MTILNLLRVKRYSKKPSLKGKDNSESYIRDDLVLNNTQTLRN